MWEDLSPESCWQGEEQSLVCSSIMVYLSDNGALLVSCFISSSESCFICGDKILSPVTVFNTTEHDICHLEVGHRWKQAGVVKCVNATQMSCVAVAYDCLIADQEGILSILTETTSDVALAPNALVMSHWINTVQFCYKWSLLVR